MVENLQKGPKKLTKSLVFKHFKMAFHFWPMQKEGKTTPKII
jgi:hypothetical protein